MGLIFGLFMENSWGGIKDQLRIGGIQLTFEIVKNAKRFHTTVGLVPDSILKVL